MPGYDPFETFGYGFKLPDTGHWESSTIAPYDNAGNSRLKPNDQLYLSKGIKFTCQLTLEVVQVI